PSKKRRSPSPPPKNRRSPSPPSKKRPSPSPFKGRQSPLLSLKSRRSHHSRSPDPRSRRKDIKPLPVSSSASRKDVYKKSTRSTSKSSESEDDRQHHSRYDKSKKISTLNQRDNRRPLSQSPKHSRSPMKPRKNEPIKNR
ncbi:unnamed protein product, partial [Rotaria sordida]